MTKILNNLDKVNYPQEKNRTPKGWDATPAFDGDRIARISDTVGSGIALEKMGTSIPTPFARIFMFKTAFEMVNASPAGATDNSAYGKLVSECLDFLEFIYNYGADITVKAWDIAYQINALKKSKSEGHNKLGNVLEHFAAELSVTDIYLIYYKNTLIGGTSPFTLVYTSPNWRRVKNITNAHGLKGNELFPDYSNPIVNATPLCQRDKDFQIMLTRMLVTYRNNDDLKNTAFFTYIYNNQDRYSQVAKDEFNNITGTAPYDIAKFAIDYSYLQVGLTDVDVFGQGGANAVFIATKPTFNVSSEASTVISDDYKIASTIQRNSLPQEPLVLSEAGITVASYVNGAPFPDNTIVNKDTTIALKDRFLPGGMHIQYPYLSEADFFQEKLLKVGYKIDQKNFMTLKFSCSSDNCDYLLPLRKEIFEYFSPEDFGTVDNLNIEIAKEQTDLVEVHLTIPVKCKFHPYIELVHTYYKEDIVVLSGAPDIFSIAVFPSCKIIAGTVPNMYSVLISDDRNKTSIEYYTITDAAIEKIEKSKSEKRQTNASSYEEIEHAFDFCEVDYDDAKAMVIPNFKKVKVSDDGGSTVVGIDFGTTNTYICYSTENGGSPQSLEITKDDLQVLTLNEIDLSKGNYGEKYKNSMFWSPSFNSALDREFVPLLLGTESDVKYPFRTVTCETDEFKNALTPQLFAHINVGFNFLKEEIELEHQSYRTSIKWDIENNILTEPLAIKQGRIRAYCEQSVWMIKNKLMLMNNPNSKINVFLTFPYTMRRTTKNTIANFWQEAFDKYMGVGNVSIERITESIAPYYYMVSNGGNFAENALNIDIGGGTTDMLFADIKHQTFYYTSSIFAGDDIWGDGKQLVNNYAKDNGFVQDFEIKLNNGAINVSDQRRAGYEKYKQIVKNSSDLMSYIFRYDSEFNYCSYISMNTDKFIPILCIHLGAILYHVAQVLKAKSIEIPSTITFSGMGSQYLHMISSEQQDIEDIVKKMLSTFINSMSKKGEVINMPKGMKVVFQAKAKEATAQGAMLVNHPSLGVINGYSEESLCVYGVETQKKQLIYADASSYKKQVIEEFEKFISLFAQPNDMVTFLKKDFNINFKNELLDVIRSEAEQSFNLMSNKMDPTVSQDDINETMFFWPLKNGLYKASQL